MAKKRGACEVDIKKVLLVDDDDNIRLIAQLTLEDEWTILSCSSGLEALSVAASEKPDLIILDMMMPGMDGKTTLARLKEQKETADIPVIFLTAKVQRQDLAAYQTMDVIGVITKPFNPLTLADEIRSVIASPVVAQKPGA
jgi:two-component system, OmpR family, response regulator